MLRSPVTAWLWVPSPACAWLTVTSEDCWLPVLLEEEPFPVSAETLLVAASTPVLAASLSRRVVSSAVLSCAPAARGSARTNSAAENRAEKNHLCIANYPPV